MTATTLQLTFARGDKGAKEIQAVINAILSEVDHGSDDLRDELQEAGLDLHEIRDARVKVNEGAQGIDPIVTPIIVGIAVAAGSKVAETLWTDIIWPRIVRKLRDSRHRQEKKH